MWGLKPGCSGGRAVLSTSMGLTHNGIKAKHVFVIAFLSFETGLSGSHQAISSYNVDPYLNHCIDSK
jgi:hypothetical protein